MLFHYGVSDLAMQCASISHVDRWFIGGDARTWALILWIMPFSSDEHSAASAPFWDCGGLTHPLTLKQRYNLTLPQETLWWKGLANPVKYLEQFPLILIPPLNCGRALTYSQRTRQHRNAESQNGQRGADPTLCCIYHYCRHSIQCVKYYSPSRGKAFSYR